MQPASSHSSFLTRANCKYPKCNHTDPSTSFFGLISSYDLFGPLNLLPVDEIRMLRLRHIRSDILVLSETKPVVASWRLVMDFLEHRSEFMCTAEIVNQTEHELEMQVGNNVHFVNFGHVGRGATHTVPVDYTDTYQEYKFSTRQQHVGSSSRSLVVTSDDCCDYKRITIMEVDGQLTVQREPRQLADPPAPAAPVVPYRACGSHVGALSWRRWIRLRVF